MMTSFKRKSGLSFEKKENMILGVSGWLGKKVGLKESYVRIGFVISVLFFGVGIGIYLILWIIKLLSK